MRSDVRVGVTTIFFVTASIMAAACDSGGSSGDDGDDQPPPGVAYQRVDLASDEAGAADRLDADLVNAWGIAAGPDTAFWIADEGTEMTSILDGDGAQVLPGIGLGGEVTGTVYNPTLGFPLLTPNQISAPAVFVFATTSGNLIGWSDKALPAAGVLAYDGTGTLAAYTGLAIADDRNGGMRLYAANFASGSVDVFDDQFRLMDTAGAFIDPDLPADYVPFGIQEVDGLIYVTYALRDEDEPDEEVRGPGLGIVNAFSIDGVLDRRVMTGGELNAPWAIARAPSSFGDFGGDLLIGNFGDGRITALASNDRVEGQLSEGGQPIAIDGLWGMMFGNDRNAGSSNALYFAAGPADEMHGLFGRIQLASRVDDPGDIGGGGGGTHY